MPVADSPRTGSSIKLRASEKLASIPEEEEDSTTQKPSNSPSLSSSNGTYEPTSSPAAPPKSLQTQVRELMDRIVSWNVVYEKDFFKYFFSCVYILAIISYFTSTLLDGNTYITSAFLFHRMMGCIYIIAFCSIWVQIIGLCGENGILPIKATIEVLIESKKPKTRVPTVFWYSQTDMFIRGVCATGLVCSFLYFANILPTLMQIICFISFLSFKTVGREFFALQFDNLLLDTSIWAILLPPIRVIPFFEIPTSNYYNTSILWLLRWLLFRLMVGSGLCKVTSGDKTWRTGTALTYHYWSQPMPNWISHYANQLPLSIQKFSCFYHFFVELAAPFGAFFPILFVPTFLIQASLQVGILLTGNYGFFNLLSVLLAFSLVPDSLYPTWLRETLAPFAQRQVSSILSFNVFVPVIPAFVLTLSLVAFSQVARGDMEIPEIIHKIQSRFSRFGLMNYYGLFARMTTTRREVIIEGSDDGRTWLEYELYYKPGDVKKRPPFVIGHLPRLDWRLWFCQFTHFNSFLPGWFDIFLMKILEGSPQVLDLISNNPFPNHPPRFLRAVMYDYNFPDEAQRKEGLWWVRSQKKMWWPPCTLHNGKMLYLK